MPCQRGHRREDRAHRLGQRRSCEFPRSRRRSQRREGLQLPDHADLCRRHRARRRDGRENFRNPRTARNHAGRGDRTNRNAALPPRQLQRHPRRRDLRRARCRARRRDRAVARRPLGQFAAAGLRHHPRGHHQRHRHQLSRRISHRDDRRAPQGGAGGPGRQPVQPGPLLPAGRRHGPRRRRVLYDRRQPRHRQPHRRPHPHSHRPAARSGRNMPSPVGQRQRGGPKARRSGMW